MLFQIQIDVYKGNILQSPYLCSSIVMFYCQLLCNQITHTCSRNIIIVLVILHALMLCDISAFDIIFH